MTGTVDALAAGLQRWFLLAVLGFAALGVGWSGPARAGVDRHGISVAVIALVAAVGLGLPASALADARTHVRRVVLAVVVPAVALPLLAWAASRTVPTGPLRLGVLAAGVAPSEVAAVALTAMADGSVALSAAVLVGSTAACVLLAGPTLHVLAGPANDFSGSSLLLSLLAIVAAPLVLGAVVRSTLPAGSRTTVDAVSSIAASAAVLVLIWLVAGQAHLGLSYLRAGMALLLYLVCSAGLATLLTRGLPAGPQLSLLLPITMRDFAIAAGIASQAFGPSAAADLGLYGLLVLLLGAGLVRLGTGRRLGRRCRVEEVGEQE